MCPCAVMMDLGKCLRTRAEVRPGQVVKKPVSIAWIHVEGTGENAALWRNMTSSFLDFVSYALNAQWAKVCGSGVSCEGGGDRSMDQRPLLILLPIWMALLSFMMHTDSEVSSTGNPASQNIPRDIKGRCRPGKMLALSAWRGRLMPRCVRSNDAMCVA